MKRLFDAIKIKLTSSEQIRNSTQTTLIDGSKVGLIENGETVEPGTLKPIINGLFCERVFGPIKDWECHCGKYKETRIISVCDVCGVEINNSKVRRYRMGYIELISPVAHIWYIKQRPSKIALALDLKRKDLENIIYFRSYVVIKAGISGLVKKNEILDHNDIEKLDSEVKNNSFKDVVIKTGAIAIKELFDELDLEKESAFLRENISTIKSKIQKAYLARRIQALESFIKEKIDPSWMLLDVIPVIPPSLRPINQLANGKFASSDLNILYSKIIQRNDRVIDKVNANASIKAINKEQCLLQESVDALFDNARLKNTMSYFKNRSLKSLSDRLKGKQGRFRKNILGKRVDYSGRSVIVVEPTLKLYQCGLPFDMAIRLFYPFLLHDLIHEGWSEGIISAKTHIKERDLFLWGMLRKIMQKHTILLNRAPTLHRLGIQAFEPLLIEGQAIQLHPLVCTAFNADFDGDQMAVHVPLSLEAQLEARVLMMAPFNVLSPATGDNIVAPTQDMILGCFYLTAEEQTRKNTNIHYFANTEDVLFAYQQSKILLHSPVWVRDNDIILKKPEKEQRIGNFIYTITPTIQIKKSLHGDLIATYHKTTPGKLLLKQCFD